jgi:gas vesicle protein
MGGGGFGRAYASGSNTQINQAALAKAIARSSPSAVQGKNINQVTEPPFASPVKAAPVVEELVSLNADPFASTVDTFPSSTEFTMVDITDGTGKVIGQSRQPVVTGGGGAKLYSDMSMAERKVVDEARDASIAATELRREEQRAANPDFDLASFYESSLASADTSAEAKRKVLTAHDPGRGELYGTTPSGYLLDQQVGDPFIEAVRTYEVPLTQKLDSPIELDYDYGYDAENLYMKQPPLLGNTDLQQGFTDEEREQYRDLMKRGSFIDISGGTSKVGEYSMVWVEDPPEPSGVSKFLNNPVLSVMGMLNPAIGLTTTAAKAATGEKLSPVEIASSLLTGLEMTGTIKAPTAGSSAAPKGGVGPTLPSEGTGLFGSTYAQTEAALNVAAAGDAKGAAIALVGSDLIKGGLDKVGLDQEVIEKAGIQYDDFEAGLEKTVQKVAEGEELDDALLSGVGKYVQEGGTLGSIDLPETNIDLGVIEDVVRDVVRPIGKVGTALADFVEEAIPEDIDKIEDALKEIGRTTDDLVLQPTKEVVQAVTEPVYKEVKEAVPIIEDVIREVGSETEDIVKAVGEEIIDVVSPIGSAVEDIARATGSTVEDVLKGVGEIGEDVIGTVGDAIEAGVETVDELLSPIGSAVEDIARATGSTVEDVLRGVGSLADDIRKDIGEVGQDVIDAISPIGSALEDVVRATGSNLEDLVKQLARMMSGALGSISLQQQEQARQDRVQAALNTRTTDSLFGEDLFKFQTEIGTDVEALEYVDLGFSDPFQEQTLTQRFP